MKPKDLATEIGKSPKTIRQILRDKYQHRKGQRWDITPDQAREIETHFRSPKAAEASSTQAKPTEVKLAPSILSADFGRLAAKVVEATQAGADYIHVDIMDGHFVPNISIGPGVVAAIRLHTRIPLDVHLMIETPEKYVEDFARAGADIIVVHAEACTHLHRVVQSIKGMGKKAGVALNPATPLSVLDEILPDLDLVLLMTVNPGFPGQKFIRSMLPKIARLRHRLDTEHPNAELEVDGGVTEDTAPLVVKEGARVLVAGSAVFNNRESVSQAMARLRNSLPR